MSTPTQVGACQNPVFAWIVKTVLNILPSGKFSVIFVYQLILNKAICKWQHPHEPPFLQGIYCFFGNHVHFISHLVFVLVYFFFLS